MQPSAAIGPLRRKRVTPHAPRAEIPPLRGRASFATASQTAWALLGYVAAGNAEGAGSRRGADYLCEIQRPDGDWDEQHFTGTGFPLDFMIRYHLYRITFPLLALGRLRERLSA